MDTNLTIDQVFAEILSGRMDASDFEQWVYNQRAEAAADAYSEAFLYCDVPDNV